MRIVLLAAWLFSINLTTASAQSWTLPKLVDACGGGEKSFAKVLRELRKEHGSEISARVTDDMREEHKNMATLVCSSYLAGALDQIIFLFDKDGLFDKADLICIPQTHYEVPDSPKQILIRRLLSITESELKREPDRTAKSWIATTMIELFPCDAPVRGRDSTPTTER
jgi:hypothetical protein